MRSIGCIPAKKFVTDTVLVRDMLYALRRLKSSVLMYRKRATALTARPPAAESLGKCIKLLGVPWLPYAPRGRFRTTRCTTI